MKFELSIIIDSSNQDVVDNPRQTALLAIERAYNSTKSIGFAPSSDDVIRAKIMDANGNTIGVATIEVTGEDSD